MEGASAFSRILHDRSGAATTWEAWKALNSKRAMDVTLGSVALGLASPILAASAIAMRLSGDRGPFLYWARRVGEGTQVIMVPKIRTMAVAASGSNVTLQDDPRVTRLGRVLRRYRIDELPQLVSVVRGQMSLVGPRPEDPAYVDLSNPLHRRVFSAKPGITGLAQLEFHDEADRLLAPDSERVYREEILPAKLKLDARYLDRQSALLDIEILLRTVRTVLR